MLDFLFGKKITREFEPETGQIPEMINWFVTEAGAMGVTQRESVRAIMSLEDVLVTMVQNAKPDAKVSMVMQKRYGEITCKAICRGEAFSLEDMEESWVEDLKSEADKEELLAFMHRLHQNKVSLHYRAGKNVYSLQVVRSAQFVLYQVLAALLLGVAFGVVARLILPQEMGEMLCEYIFTPVNSMFMNALKTMVTPLIFFSIASSLACYGDLKSLGRLASEVMGGYMCTSVVAIIIGFLVYQVFPIGDSGLVSAVTETDMVDKVAASGQLSIKDLIVNVVPTNIVNPFLHMDMLSVIFLGMVLGIAAAELNETAPNCAKLINDGNELFSKAILLVMVVMPFAIFCSMAKMVMTCSVSSLMSLLVWVPVVYLGCFCMIIFYILMLSLLGGMNGLNVMKQAIPVMLVAFATGSTSVTLPVTMKACKEALKIDSRIYSFSLPLGATVNMDGSTVTLIITGMFALKVFGIEVTSDVLMSMAITVLLLSVGAPGVTGATLLCMAMLFPVINVPAEAVSLFIGLYPLVGRALTVGNVIGDLSITTLIAKKEHMLYD